MKDKKIQNTTYNDKKTKKKMKKGAAVAISVAATALPLAGVTTYLGLELYNQKNKTPTGDTNDDAKSVLSAQLMEDFLVLTDNKKIDEEIDKKIVPVSTDKINKLPSEAIKNLTAPTTAFFAADSVSPTTATVQVEGIEVIFLPTANDDKGEITYTISEVKKGAALLNTKDNKINVFTGVIKGFKTNDQNSVNNLANADIKTALEATLFNAEIKGVALPTDVITTIKTRLIKVQDINVEFKVTADNLKGEIEYEVTKVTKNNAALSDVSALKGSMSGFVTEDEKQMHNLSKTEIYNAISLLLVDKATGKEIIKDLPSEILPKFAKAADRVHTFMSGTNDGITIKFDLVDAKDAEGSLGFKVTEAKKGTNKPVDDLQKLAHLNDTIKGFKTTEIATIEGLTKQDIQLNVEALFTSVKNQLPSVAITKMTANTTELVKTIGGIAYKFIIKFTPKAEDKDGKITYTIDSVRLNNSTLPTAKLAALDGEVIDFVTTDQDRINKLAQADVLDAIDKALVDRATAKIKTNHLPDAMAAKFVDDAARTVTLNAPNADIKLIFKIDGVGSANNVAGTLAYKIVSLQIGIKTPITDDAKLNHLNGVVSGFKTTEIAIIEGLTKQEVQRKINALFTPVKTELPTAAIAKVTAKTIELEKTINTVIYKFIIKFSPTAEDITGKIIYTIDSVKLNNSSLSSGKLAALNGEVTGLLTKEQQLNNLDVSIIQNKVEALFTTKLNNGDKKQTLATDITLSAAEKIITLAAPYQTIQATINITSQDVNKGEVKYVLTELKDTPGTGNPIIITAAAQLAKFAGTSTGYATNDEKTINALVVTDVQKLINDIVVGKIPNGDKTKLLPSEVKNLLTANDKKVQLNNDMSISFEITANDNEGTLAYTLNKLQLNIAALDSAKLTTLNSSISGFQTTDELTIQSISVEDITTALLRIPEFMPNANELASAQLAKVLGSKLLIKGAVIIWGGFAFDNLGKIEFNILDVHLNKAVLSGNDKAKLRVTLEGFKSDALTALVAQTGGISLAVLKGQMEGILSKARGNVLTPDKAIAGASNAGVPIRTVTLQNTAGEDVVLTFTVQPDLDAGYIHYQIANITRAGVAIVPGDATLLFTPFDSTIKGYKTAYQELVDAGTNNADLQKLFEDKIKALSPNDKLNPVVLMNNFSGTQRFVDPKNNVEYTYQWANPNETTGKISVYIASVSKNRKTLKINKTFAITNKVLGTKREYTQWIIDNITPDQARDIVRYGIAWNWEKMEDQALQEVKPPGSANEIIAKLTDYPGAYPILVKTINWYSSGGTQNGVLSYNIDDLYATLDDGSRINRTAALPATIKRDHKLSGFFTRTANDFNTMTQTSIENGLLANEYFKSADISQKSALDYLKDLIPNANVQNGVPIEHEFLWTTSTYPAFKDSKVTLRLTVDENANVVKWKVISVIKADLFIGQTKISTWVEKDITGFRSPIVQIIANLKKDDLDDIFNPTKLGIDITGKTPKQVMLEWQQKSPAAGPSTAGNKDLKTAGWSEDETWTIFNFNAVSGPSEIDYTYFLKTIRGADLYGVFEELRVESTDNVKFISFKLSNRFKYFDSKPATGRPNFVNANQLPSTIEYKYIIS